MNRSIWALIIAIPLLASEPAPTVSGIWMMGQSLCDGSESLPLVTPTDTGWGNLMFLRGVRTWLPQDHPASPEKRANESFRRVPLHAQVNGGLGETAANGMADHWRAARMNFSQTPAAVTPPRFLVACAGQGGRQIQELSSADLSTDERTPVSRRHGGGYYRTSLDDARRAVQQAGAAGEVFRIEALYWMQGEGNGGPAGGIMPTRWDRELPRQAGLAWYRDQLIAYRKGWSADLGAVTGQQADLPMFTYQTLGPAGEAQLMAADKDPRIHLVGPHYAVTSAIHSRYPPGRHGDPIHLSADGERWWGEQVGKVMHRVLDKGESWQPLRPRRARLLPGRTAMEIEFTVPRPPLVIDTDFLARQETAASGGFTSLAGFRAHDGNGRTLSLSSVTVSGPASIRIQLTKPLPEDETCRLSYGHPFAAALGSIVELQKAEGGLEDVMLEGLLMDRLRPLINEGAFLITSLSGTSARVVIRSVREDAGRTLLRYDAKELRNAVRFEKGQAVTAQRSFSYGNLRDSDPERSVHSFADAAYGARAGQPYPLWNWCVLFSDLSVAAD
jgi:hypothetical protein